MSASADRAASAEAHARASARPEQKATWRRTILRALLIAVIVFVLIVAIGLFVVPRVIKSKLEETLSGELHRTTTVERVTFNPFSLAATIDGLVVRNRDADTPLLSVKQLVADLSTATLWHRAPVVDALVVQMPELNLVRNADGTYNVQDLIDAYFSSPPGPPPAFSLNNIELVDGGVKFDDRTVKRVHKIEGLRIGIPFLSSLPYDTEVKVAPALSARIDDAGFALTGETTPFAASQRASLDIDLNALSLPQILDYMPMPLKVKIPSGELTTKLKFAFVGGSVATRALVVTGDVVLAKLVVQRADGAPLIMIPEARMALAKVDVFGHAIDVTRLDVVRPELDVRRKSDGEIEWAALAGAASLGAQPVAAQGGTTAPAWQVRLADVTVDGATVRVEDQSTTPQFRSTLGDLKLRATGLGNSAGSKGRVELSLNTDLGATIAADTEVTLIPMALTGKLRTIGVDLKKLFPYYESAINLEVADGALDFVTTFAIRAREKGEPAITLSEGSAEVRNLRLLFPGEKDPLWTVPKLNAAGINVDVDTRTVGIDDLSGKEAVMRIRRDNDGTFNFARIIRTTASTGRNVPVPSAGKPPQPAPSATAVPAAPPAAVASADATWQLLVRKFALERTTVDFQDRVPAKPVSLRFTELDVRTENFTNGRGKRGPFELRTKVGANGRLAAKGSIGTNPAACNLRIDAQGLALPPLQPYLDDVTHLAITSGAVAMKGNLVVEPQADSVRTAFTGDVVIGDFVSLDKVTASDLVTWKTLTLTGIDAASAPVKLGVNSIALDGFYARMIVYQDGSLNLTQLLATGNAADAPKTDTAPASKPPAAATQTSVAPVKENATTSAGLPITLGQIVLTKGTVEFSDFFVKPNYSADLTDVNGKVSAMSKEQAGEVEITAAVERTAPVDVRGRINPFAKEIDLDLIAKASEIDLPPLSPYAGKYAGYAIDKGKLSFNVHYKIENRTLSAENELILDQLTFGDRIESPTATKLPVLLAVALLKDRHGVINIHLPISGSLDDPQFSVGGLIIQVIINLITKVVTAPFALLGAVFGGGEQLAYVEFAPGLATITPAGETKLKTLSKALVDRPALKLDITGHADAATDAEGLRRAELGRAVKAQKRKALAAEDGSPPPVETILVEPAEYPRYLEAAYADATFDKPRNAIGMVKSLPPPEMEALILQSVPTNDEALRALAYDRAEAVKGWLMQNGVPADRVFLLAPKSGAVASKDGGGPNRVDFALR